MSFPFFVPSVINTNPVTAIPIGSYITSPVYSSEFSVSVQTDYPNKSENVLVTSLPTTNYYLPTSFFYPSDTLTYPYPMYKNISYLDINADKELHKKVTKYFFSQLYNIYVPEDNSELLDYVKISAKDIELVKSLNEAKNNKTKEDDVGEKINYLADYIFTKKDIYSVLWDYAEKRNIKWWDLKHYGNDIENILIRELQAKIKDMILE